MSACVEVFRAGLFTTVQDGGRWGWQTRGVSVAGPMDPFAHRMANALVGNDRSAAGLEITLTGPELLFEETRLVAVAGAFFPLFVNDKPVPGRQAFSVPSGSRLRFGTRGVGARSYLAVAGGFDVPLVLGSRATHVPSTLGGWRGRPLTKGDRLPLLGPTVHRDRHIHPTAVDPRIPATSSVRVLPGPDLHRFAREALNTLQSSPYVVSNDSDRMGYRLTGARLPHSDDGPYISDVTSIGAIQVPHSGQPILLMADRQTAGGYPKIATVISADIGVVGQAAPGDVLRFNVCTPQVAHGALLEVEKRLMAIEAAR